MDFFKQANNFDLSHLTGPFDIIGDVHGCFDELFALLRKLGYLLDGDKFYHPYGRKLIFVGDLVDRGPKTPEVLQAVMQMVESGVAYCVKGNHDDKLKRKLEGRDVKIAHGLAESLEQLKPYPHPFLEKVFSFLSNLPPYYICDSGKLAVCHAGLKEDFIGKTSKGIEAYCMYGPTTGKLDEYGLPERLDWTENYNGQALVIYGHTPTSEVNIKRNTINIDTGCVFGRKLTAFRYPEMVTVSQPAFKQYHKSVRPF